MITNTYFAKRLYDIATGVFGKTTYRRDNTADNYGWQYNLLTWYKDHWCADCIGFIKAVVNGWNADKSRNGGGMALDGYQDLTEAGLLATCSDRSKDFTKLTVGEYLYMDGHGGIYIGEKTVNGKQYNVAECTMSWGGGCLLSYVAQDGGRYNHRGGSYSCKWQEHGKLDRIKYTDGGGGTQPSQDTYVTISVYEDIDRLWLAQVNNTTISPDYAGIFGHDVDNVMLKITNGGSVKYRVHTWKGDASEKYPNAGKWLPAVTGYNRNDYNNGYAGDNTPIDGFCIESASKEVMYRVHLRKSGEWLPWVSSKKGNINDATNGFAGIIGLPIDAIEVKFKA